MKQPITEKAYGNWRVSIYPHPIQLEKFSYTLALTDQLQLNPEPITPTHPHLFGCFDNSLEALENGIERIKNSVPERG
jgi:hypothetical protein